MVLHSNMEGLCPNKFKLVELFDRKQTLNMFSNTVDIYSGVFGHVETVVLMSRK